MTDDEECIFLNNTHMLIAELRSTYYAELKPQSGENYGGMPLPPPIILEAQLLFKASDKRRLRAEIQQLIRKHEIRSFELDSYYFPGERFFLSEYDYAEYIKKQNIQIGQKFVDQILVHQTNSIVSSQTLKKNNFSDDEIRELARLHILRIHENDYELWVPNISATISSIIHGRRGIVTYIKRIALKTCELSALESRNIPESFMKTPFHIHSMLGVGIIEVIHNTGRPDQVRLVQDPFVSK